MENIINLFRKNKIQHKYVIDNPFLLKSISSQNRLVLNSVSQWLSEEKAKGSYYNYGVPETIRDLLDLEVGDEITYTDLMLYYTNSLNKKEYLELGVSVGKNFLQVASYFENTTLTGFDIEDINTPLENRFTYLDKVEWASQPASLRKDCSTLKKFQYNSNSINYLAGDIWDENSWSKLKGSKFNIIFSDALHDPKALLWEYEMIKKYQLLDKDFIFMWDDLNNGLEESFKTIAIDLKKDRSLDNKSTYLIKVNGWLGKNYPHKHDIGIVSNIALK